MKKNKNDKKNANCIRKKSHRGSWIAFVFLSLIFTYFLLNWPSYYKTKEKGLNSSSRLNIASSSGFKVKDSVSENSPHLFQSKFLNKIENKVQKQILKKVFMESKRIAQEDISPEKTEENLFQLAKKMNEESLRLLKDTSLDQEEDGDLRFLSIYLISKNQSPYSPSLLEEIINSPINEKQDSHLYSSELILRYQAIDGLAFHPDKKKSLQMIKESLKKINNPALADRMQSTYWHLKKGTASPIEQESKAFARLLEE